MTRRGPRSAGSPDTREMILAEARTSFAELGYDRSTIRLIATKAGVDPSLVIHYFGSKEDLFAASVELPMSPEALVNEVFREGAAAGDLPERMVRVFFEVWERPESREALQGQLRVALTTGRPPPMGAFVVDVIVRRIAEFVDGPDSDLRLELAASHLVGIAIMRYVVGMEPLASMPVDRIVAEVAPRVRSYLTNAPRDDLKASV